MLNEGVDAPLPPVLILLSSAAREDIGLSYEKGCNAYLTNSGDMGNYARLAKAIEEF